MSNLKSIVFASFAVIGLVACFLVPEHAWFHGSMAALQTFAALNSWRQR